MDTKELLTQIIGQKPTQAQIDLFEKNATVLSQNCRLIIQGCIDNPEITNTQVYGKDSDLVTCIGTSIANNPKVKYLLERGIAEANLFLANNKFTIPGAQILDFFKK